MRKDRVEGERFVGDSEWRADGDVCEAKGEYRYGIDLSVGKEG